MSREMKDSGSPWIGKVPKEWIVIRMKSCILRRDGGAWGDSPQNNEGDIICLRIADFDYKKCRFKEKGEFTVRNYSQDIIEKLILKSGDIIIEKSGGGEKTPVGRTVVFDKPYKAVYANFCDRIRCRDDIVKPDYMQYVFVAFYQNRYVWNYIKQTTGIQNLDLTTLLSVEKIALPSYSEQTRIVSFLDKQCAYIDSVLEKTKVSIEEYKILKQAIITQTVTKGLRTDTGRIMKDSGIKWIGKMPDNWKLLPFRRVLKERNEKNSPIKSRERLSLSIDLGVTLYSEKTTNLDRFKENFEQYKVAHKGDLVMNSMNMIVGASGQSKYYGCVSPVYYTFYDETEDHCTAKFCEYVFRSKTMLRVLFSLGKGIYAIVRGDDKVNTCRLKVSKEDLKSIVIPIPPLEEQREIITFLDKKCNQINKIIEKKEQFVNELENYKKSVIYEYVTGKKEVPES